MSTSQLSLVPNIESLGRASDYAYEFAAAARSSSLFGGFSLHECNIFSAYMKCFGVPRNTPILRQSRTGDLLIVVLTGSVDVVKADMRGAQKVLAHVGPGGIAGEMSLVDGGAYDASCIATEPTDFAVLTRASLDAMVCEHPRVGNKFISVLMQLLTRRLREFTGPFDSPTMVGVCT